MPSNPDRIAARYTGGNDGQYHHGVPLRDLTAAEFDALPLETRELLITSPIYEVTPASKASVTREGKAEETPAEEQVDEPVEEQPAAPDETPVVPAEEGN
jgi:hypothetical protein